MEDRTKSREQLIEELREARNRVASLEAAELRRQQVEGALREANEQYRNLFEFASDSIFIVEPSTMQFIDANQNAVRRLGYNKEELLRLTLTDVEVKQEKKEEDDAFAWKSQVSNTFVFESVYRRKDGSTVPVEVSTRLIKYGKRRVFQNFVRDLTVRKRIEDEREKLIADLNAFAHTVAHDLKTPLSVIVGYADMLVTMGDKISEEELHGYLQRISGTGYKMTNIIEELLLLSSIRTLDEVRLEPLDTARIVDEVQQRLGNMITDYEALFAIPESWPPALGYPAWVEEVWTNYISNALKYGGSPPHIKLGATVEGNMVRFWVRDNGEGLTQEQQEQLFDKFVRLDKTRAEGHGLGLSIVHRIIEKLGGEVAVKSQLGEGSIFSFTLPRAAG